MNKTLIVWFLSLFIFSISAQAKRTSSGITMLAEKNGLQLVKSSLDDLFVRPQVDLKRYKKIIIEPLVVNYSKEKRISYPTDRHNRYQFNDNEKQHLQVLFAKAFGATWQDAHGWQLTETAGPDTLQLKVNLDDLLIYAPLNNDQPYRVQHFTNHTSKMFMHLELYDSETGDLLLLSNDKRKTGKYSSDLDPQPFSIVSYWSDIRREFSSMARYLNRYIEN